LALRIVIFRPLQAGNFQRKWKNISTYSEKPLDTQLIPPSHMVLVCRSIANKMLHEHRRRLDTWQSDCKTKLLTPSSLVFAGQSL
jgi:hypothetical protein